MLDGARAWLSRRRQEEQEFRQVVRAQNIESANQLANLSDAELIATDPSIPGHGHEMEMYRRLKAAIQKLTAETMVASPGVV